ncbi:DUF1732 domain-containing protein [Salipiger sp. IMCC34102]|uniref:YicC family protein n=1 Tax=Salipiger sp. IMCC34102 TaxID=2510647 RepID=UPI00101D1429|nr:DUF1732 domain-containing protein [Salipiger sp. IMCC34102]RYH03153.1 DUF1732 domain-containing protein [Salipiger sp. IMCC34102]
MLNSMTAIASRRGQGAGTAWTWHIRSHNARGLDLRLSLPTGFERLETTLRRALGKALTRGTVQVTLTVETAKGDAGPPDPDRLDAVLQAMDAVQDRAVSLGVTLGQPTAADVLDRVAEGPCGRADADLIAAMTTDLGPLLSDLTSMRADEGRALQQAIATHVETAQDLLRQMRENAPARTKAARAGLREGYARLMSEVTEADDARIMQELAVLALRRDVTEEIDRLAAHLAAIWDAMDLDAPSGRRLEFLAEEAMREANTLCAKAADPDLSALGIELKLSLDRLREQARNVE